MFSEHQLIYKALLQDKKCKSKKKKKILFPEKKAEKTMKWDFARVCCESLVCTRQILISFNNLSKTDDIHAPTVLSIAVG